MIRTSRLTRTSLRGRWRRTILSGVAVVLGVAFLTGVNLLSDTLSGTAGSLIRQSLAGVDAVIRSTSTTTSGAATVRQTISASWVDTVRSTEGVAAAEGVVNGFVRLVAEDGRPIGSSVIPTVVFNWIDDPDLSPLHLDRGRPPRGDGEILIDRRTATEGRLDIGDSLRIQGPTGVTVARVVGVGGLASDGHGTIGTQVVALPTTQAQRLTATDDQFSYLIASARPGVEQRVLAASLREQIRDPGLEVTSGAEFIGETTAMAGDAISTLTRILQAFAVVGLAMGGIVVANTFSILTAQRGRELALLRGLGATRGQIARAVLAEGGIVGVVGTLFGLLTGSVVAALVARWIGRVLTMSRSWAVPGPGLIAVAFALGVGVTTIASAIPAWRSARLAPVAVMADLPETSTPSRTRSALGALIVIAGLGLTLWTTVDPGEGDRLGVFGVGGGLVLFGLGLLGPSLTRPLIGAVCLLLPRRSTVIALARRNSLRHPRRTAASASGLVVGVTVAGALAVIAASLVGSVRTSLSEQIRADLVVDGGLTSPVGGGLPESAAPSVTSLPFIVDSSRLRVVPATVMGARPDRATLATANLIAGVDVPSYFRLVDLHISAGDPRDLTRGTIAVHADLARRSGWALGDEVDVTYPQAGIQRYRIAVLFDRNPLVAQYLVPMGSLDDVTTIALRQDLALYLRLAPGVDPTYAAREVDRRLLDTAPVARTLPTAEWVAATLGPADSARQLVLVLLVFALIMGGVGILNTQFLSVSERTREFGVLRTVGATDRQLRRIVIGESLLVGVWGALLGLGAGIWLGVGLVRTASIGSGLSLRFPLGQLALIATLGAVVGVLGGLWPARRATRLEVLTAVDTA